MLVDPYLSQQDVGLQNFILAKTISWVCEGDNACDKCDQIEIIFGQLL